jgi:hypothetical protein
VLYAAFASCFLSSHVEIILCWYVFAGRDLKIFIESPWKRSLRRQFSHKNLEYKMYKEMNRKERSTKRPPATPTQVEGCLSEVTQITRVIDVIRHLGVFCCQVHGLSLIWPICRHRGSSVRLGYGLDDWGSIPGRGSNGIFVSSPHHARSCTSAPPLRLHDVVLN